MTTVILDVLATTADGARRAHGAMIWQPTRHHTAPAGIVLPVPHRVTLPREQITLSPTDVTWCYRVTEPGARVPRYLAVPESAEPVLYSKLAEVDPTTLEPTAEPEAAWWAEVSGVKNTITTGRLSEASLLGTIGTEVGPVVDNLVGTAVEEAVPGAVADEITSKGLVTSTDLAGVVAGRPVSGIKPPRLSKVATTLQEGHGFTVLGGPANAESLVADTDLYVRGRQSLALRPRIAVATASSVQNTNLPPFDATDQALVVTFHLSDHTRVSELIFYASSDAAFTSYFQWRLHGLEESQQWTKSGEWVTLTLPFASATVIGTPDRAAIRVARLRAASPVGQDITVRFNLVGTTPQPAEQGVVSIAVDDIYTSTWTQMRPILDQYGYGATIYAIDSRAHLVGLDRLHQLEDASGWEVAGHGLTDLTTMSLAEAEADVIATQQWLRTHGFRGVDHYAYAGGRYNPQIEAFMRRYYRSARTIVSYGMPHETVPPANPYRLRALSVAYTTPPSVVIGHIDKVVEEGGWFILTLHDITPGEASLSTQYSAANLDTILAHVNSIGVPVRTVGDVLAGL